MMPKHTGEPDFALIGLALLIILAFMMWQDRPIQSPRPYDSAGKHQQNPRITGHTYESWLWQDPFGFDPGDDKLHNKLHETFKISVGESHSLAEESRKNNDLCYCENGLLTQEISKISENQQGVPVKILIPSIEIKPNTVESKEFRTRYRYAVVSGLIEEGYRPSKPHPINFCTSQNNQGELQYDIRWEHFKRNDKDNLFVIWGTDKKTFKTRMTSSMHKGITIIDLPSSINTENSLLEPLINELYTHRQLLPSEIATISEYDTKEVQTLTNNFWSSIKKTCSENENNRKNGCNSDISTYTYLKGLDAYQRQLGKQDREGAGKTAEKREELLSIMDQHNLPIGAAQFDYLYRLVKQIKESHKNSDRSKHIKAVGVFGSDFYDKLIIFEALRADIPNIVLFTTDLDAEMLHPQYWRWTRNLIVATPYDLRLKKDLQNQTPPFRDSLQTQIFHETLKNVKSNIPNAAPSLIFEIGRNGPVYLDGNQENSVHPDYPEPQNRLKDQLILWFFIAIALIFTVQQIKPHSGAIVFWLMATTMALFALAGYAINWGEPFSFTDGISMWPSILLRWFTFFVVIAFFFSAIRALEANFDRLNRRYYPDLADELITLWKDEKPFSESELLNWKIIEQSSNRLKPSGTTLLAFLIITLVTTIYALTILDSISIRFFFLIVLIFLLIFWVDQILLVILILILILIPLVIISILMFFIKVTPSYENLDERIIEVALIALICLVARFGKKIKSIQIMVEKDTVRTQETERNEYTGKDLNNKKERIVIPSEDLWKDYYLHGRFRHRLLRASLKFSIFMLVAAFLYQLFPTLPPPCRGQDCIFWEETSRVLSFSIIMLLTFLVLDAQRLCLHWIEKIRTKHPLFVHQAILPKHSKHFININDCVPNYVRIYFEIKSLYEKLKSGNKIPTDSEKNSLDKLEEQLTRLENDTKNPENSSNQCQLKKLRKNLEILKTNVLPAYAQKDPAEALKSLQGIVTLVAKRTRTVDRLIYYPIIAIMLLLIARMSYFDNIAFPLHVGFTVILSISLLLYAGAKLRIEAIQLKRAAINCAKNLPHPNKEDVIREIQEIDYGAFEPFFEQPAIRSLLLTLGFLGLIIGEYFRLFG